MPKWVYGEKQCEKCLKQVKLNCFTRHVRTCKGPIERKIRKAWNKGLTSETDSRVAAIAEKCSKAMVGKTGPRHTETSKMKLSIKMSERLLREYAEGTRQQVGGYCKWFEVDGWKVQGTWELRTAKILSKWKHEGKIKSWSHGTSRVSYLFNGKERTYIVDFTITRNDSSEYFIEVKGRRSLCDPLKWEAARQISPLEIWTLKEIIKHETS